MNSPPFRSSRIRTVRVRWRDAVRWRTGRVRAGIDAGTRRHCGRTAAAATGCRQARPVGQPVFRFIRWLRETASDPPSSPSPPRGT